MSEKSNLEKLLEYASRKGASDIHLRIGEPPSLRIRGNLLTVNGPPLQASSMVEICKSLMVTASAPVDLTQVQELDGSFDLGVAGRFRFNIFRHDGALGIVLRVIPPSVLSLDQLNFPPVIKEISTFERGLILVTGSTGQGKSTTLAAMLDHLNSTRKAHIITIEDPIEFLHRPKQSKITQREVGRDTASFTAALRSALRQDPNVILVGELRDPESIDMALKASETGHTVLSTLHTTDVSKSIGRIVSMFPPAEQALVRLRLADSLRAIISQRLLSRADGMGRVVAQEIMVSNVAIAECIADEKRTAEIPNFMENATTLTGSQTFRQHLSQLYRDGIITLEVAKQASANASDFEHALNYEKNDTNQESDTRGTGSKIEAGGLELESVVHLNRGHNERNVVTSESGNSSKNASANGFLGKVFRAAKRA
jgi:twitching motility protein PilT